MQLKMQVLLDYVYTLLVSSNDIIHGNLYLLRRSTLIDLAGFQVRTVVNLARRLGNNLIKALIVFDLVYYSLPCFL